MKRSRMIRKMGMLLTGGVLLQAAGGCDLAGGVLGLVAQELILSGLFSLIAT